MILKSIKELPDYTSELTMVQKSKVLKTANLLIKNGFDADAAIMAASADIVKRVAEPVEKVLGQEEMISYEIVYEPDEIDAHGNWMSKETIEAGYLNYEAAYKAGSVSENLFHLEATNSFTILKTWIQQEMDVTVTKTGQLIKAGSWVAMVKYNDPGIWELKKAGVVGGLSIQCTGYINEDTGEITGLDFGVQFEED